MRITQFNTSKLLNGTFQDTEFEIGYDESPQHTHTLSIENIKPTALGVWSSSTQLEKTATGAKANPNGTITTAETHGFVAGDVITYEVPSGATPLAGLISGSQYKIAEPIAAKTFSLVEIELTPAGAGGNGVSTNAITFNDADADSNDEVDNFTGAGTKFHLANIAGSPSTTQSGSTTDLNSSITASVQAM